jgi:hypothetical protein
MKKKAFQFKKKKFIKISMKSLSHTSSSVGTTIESGAIFRVTIFKKK